MYPKIFKPIFDAVASLVMLLVAAPVMIAVACMLVVTNRERRVFFVQERPGKGGKVFKLVKFKTMTDLRDAQGNLLSDKERLTKVGRVVRSLSLDELPQLLNVLKGDMSLVGPRPLLIKYLPLYSACQARRHEVRPGITGWAQVNGRNALSWAQRFEYDVYYVDHMSLVLDLRILLQTLLKVVRREGISSGSCETMEPFTGN